ncbi:MAG: hypothetical protein ACRDRX_14035 [Pseudonocardiaceae bacterium]
MGRIGTPALQPAVPVEAHSASTAAPPKPFDRDYREALAQAGRMLDLEGIYDTLEHCEDAFVDHAGQARAPVGLVRRAVELPARDLTRIRE